MHPPLSRGGNGRVLIKYLDCNKKDFTSNSHPISSSIAISSAVTALARIYMSPFLSTYGTYYTDTDSIFTGEVLPSEYVGNELGQFKLEHKFDEAVFLAPAPPKEGGVWG